MGSSSSKITNAQMAPAHNGSRHGSVSSTGTRTVTRFGMKIKVGSCEEEVKETAEACPPTPSFKNNKIKVIEGRGFNDDQMKNPRYMLPVDHEEMDRLNMQHYAIKYHLQR